MNFNCTAAIISEIGSIDDSWRFSSKIGSDLVMVSEYALSNGSSKMSLQCNSYIDPKSKKSKTELLVRNLIKPVDYFENFILFFLFLAQLLQS